MNRKIIASIVTVLCSSYLFGQEGREISIDSQMKKERFFLTASILPWIDLKKGSNALVLLSDLKANYVWHLPHLVMYTGIDFEQERHDIFGAYEEKRLSLGLASGVLIGDLQLGLGLLPYGNYQNETVSYSYGCGAKVDFSYRWHITKNITAGPQISVRYMRYSQSSKPNDALSISESKNHLSLIPLFSSAFRF